MKVKSGLNIDFKEKLKSYDPPLNLIIRGVTFIRFFDKITPFAI